MSRYIHPETGQTRRAARGSLFALLVGTVFLSLLLEMLLNCLPVPDMLTPYWWITIGVIVLLGLATLYILVVWDDRHIGRSETQIELLLPYLAQKGPADAQIGRRQSYAVTLDAETAWNAYRAQTKPPAGASGRSFHQAILPEHMPLVRHLLLVYLARFGRRNDPQGRLHGFLRLDMPVQDLPWEALPPSARDNPVSQAAAKARPNHLTLPQGTCLEMYDQGEVLLRLRWRPAGPLWRRLGCVLLSLGPHRPGGQVTVRWLGPLSDVNPHDKRYEQMTTRLRPADPGTQIYVINTRLAVEVESRWNALDQVARFRDWAVNLAWYLEQQLDYWRWRDYGLQRTIEDLDWKIGWIGRGEEPGLAERLRRLDGRLARLEAHLWPDEPPDGGGGAWLSKGGDDAGGSDSPASVD